jgi:hypothetical protein
MRKELGERASEHGVRKKKKGKGNHGGWFRVGSSEVLGMRTLFADLQYAMRQLRRSPCLRDYGRSELTMAIGANVVVFGVNCLRRF